MTDTRSDEAAAYRKLYNGSRWRRLRRLYLDESPLCVWCLRKNQIVAANVVDHILPHRGRSDLFYASDNLQALCADCHNSQKQSMERTGRTYDSAVGADGVPVDPAHPWHAKG